MEVREKVAVNTPEPGGVLRVRESLHLHHVHLVAVARVGEADLLVQVLDESQRLEMRVELLDSGHGDLGEVLHDVAHGHVVREPHVVRHPGEAAPGRRPPHPLRQVSRQTEPGPASREPETDLALKQMILCSSFLLFSRHSRRDSARSQYTPFETVLQRNGYFGILQPGRESQHGSARRVSCQA